MGSWIAHVDGSVNEWQYAEDSSDSNKAVYKTLPTWSFLWSCIHQDVWEALWSSLSTDQNTGSFCFNK